jgi:hypothetical protein
LATTAHPPDVDASVSHAPARRPTAVTIVGVLVLAAGALNLAKGVVSVLDGGDASSLAEAATDLALGLLALAIARGTFRMAFWAWGAIMTWAAIGLTDELIRHFFYRDVNYALMAIDAAVVLVLTPRDMQVAFEVRSPPAPVLEPEQARAARS